MTEVPTKNGHIKPANSAIIINLVGLMQVNIIVNGGENETYSATWTFWQTLDNKTGNLAARRKRALCEVEDRCLKCA